MKKQLTFYFDSSSCSGCKTCQMACRDKHDLARGVLWRRVYEVAGGDWKKEGQWPGCPIYTPTSSQWHAIIAKNLICLTSCPNKAISKNDNGIVLIDEKKCMGCRYCEWTCPYGALHYDSQRGVMSKCTMCEDLILQGKKPACISACPMRAMEITDGSYGWNSRASRKTGYVSAAGS
jgi:anaerobic dimethyl sulfoxide reductase subunit B